MKTYGILIPALNPDKKLLDLIHELLRSSVPVQALVVVGDGSDQQAQPVWKRADAQVSAYAYSAKHFRYANGTPGDSTKLREAIA